MDVVEIDDGDLFFASPDPAFDLQVILNERNSPCLFDAALKIALLQKSIAALVLGDLSGEFCETGHELLRRLRPFQLSERETDEWPGTRMCGGTAIVREYRVVAEVYALLQSVGHFLSFLHPEFPEDLGFCDKNGNYWLYTTTHERFCAISTARIPSVFHSRIRSCIRFPQGEATNHAGLK